MYAFVFAFAFGVGVGVGVGDGFAFAFAFAFVFAFGVGFLVWSFLTLLVGLLVFGGLPGLPFGGLSDSGFTLSFG